MYLASHLFDLFKKIPKSWGLIVLLVLLAYWQFSHNQDLNATITEQKCIAEQAGEAQQVATGAAQVTEQSVAKSAQTATELTANQKVIDEEVERRVAEIRKIYADKDEPKAAADAVSRARLDSLWDTYCTGDQDSTGCTR